MLTHTEEQQHACPDCDQWFTRASDLKIQMLTHTEEKNNMHVKNRARGLHELVISSNTC